MIVIWKDEFGEYVNEFKDRNEFLDAYFGKPYSYVIIDIIYKN